MIEGIMESYHLSLLDAMQLTLPQVIMLNHAAWVNYERAKKRSEADQQERSEVIATHMGKPLDKCNSAEWVNYMSDWGPGAA